MRVFVIIKNSCVCRDVAQMSTRRKLKLFTARNLNHELLYFKFDISTEK